MRRVGESNIRKAVGSFWLKESVAVAVSPCCDRFHPATTSFPPGCLHLSRSVFCFNYDYGADICGRYHLLGWRGALTDDAGGGA